MNGVDELKTADAAKDVSRADAARVSFTPEQQAKVQELIDDAYRKAFTKAAKGTHLSDEVEALKGELSRLQDERKMAAVLRAVSRHNVVDAEEVAELISRRVVVDDGGRIFAGGGADGATPMGLEEFVGKWIDERPHHVRSAAFNGAGSHGARFGSTRSRHDLSSPEAWRSMPREEFRKYLVEGIDIHGAAGQVFKFKDVANPFLEARKARFAKTQG